MSDDVGLAKSRSRRSRDGKASRFDLLKQAREARSRGEKMTFLDQDESNVYDEVDEDEYSKIVQQRLEDDWIVNDEGDEEGYVDDGREIFDEMEEGEEETRVDKKGKKKRNANIRKPGQSESVSEESKNAAAKQRQFMTQFLANKPEPSQKKTKKKEDVTLVGDNNLDDLLKELKGDAEPVQFAAPIDVKKKKKKKKKHKPDPIPVASSVPKERPAANPFANRPAAKPVSSRPFLDSVPTQSGERMEIEEVVKEKIPEQPQLSPKEEAAEDSQLDISDINFDEPIADVKVKESSWASHSADNETSVPLPTVTADSALPLVPGANDQQVFRFFWLDAYEDMKLHPGTVYLFGKTRVVSGDKTCVSCCVRVKEIRRRLYFLPRKMKINIKSGEETHEEVTMEDVKMEVSALLREKYKIFNFKCQTVTRNYAFELRDVPAESEYLEVVYHPSKGLLAPNLKGKTFSRVFGTRTSSLEQFILDHKLKGPGWLDVMGAQQIRPPLSWCKFEVDVSDPNQISRASATGLQSPPLTVLAVSIKTVTNSKDFQNEIVSVGGLIHNEFFIDKPAPKKLFQSHFTIISHPSDRILPFDLRERLKAWGPPYSSVHVEGSERALLGRLLSRFHLLDPDIIIGHDLFSFELDVLTQRLAALKVPHWHKIGRLKRGVAPPKVGGAMRNPWLEKSAFAGRIVCDSLVSAKELIRARSYDLSPLIKQVLRCERPAPPPDLRLLFGKSEQTRGLIDFTMGDASFVIRLVNELQVLPLATQITGVCGNLLSRTLIGGRAERNEFLLLHAFTQRNFIVPDKLSFTEQQRIAREEGEEAEEEKKGRKKPAYAGGLVLDPKKGFYDKMILLLDFNSLYPSIIQEYNICFTTVERKEAVEGEMPDIPGSGLSAGVLPTEIRKLVESRREVKKLMKAHDLTADTRAQYDIRQKALKITANSMYGCLGFSHSRFFAKPLAALITYKGREILMKTKELVEGMNLEVIYGDTDSIMVNSNCTDYDLVFKLGNKIKAEVNKLYRLLELDIDGVFKSMLLLKKKKYAALTICRNPNGQLETSQELKGLDIVRRDWCRLAVDIGHYVVSQILSGQSREEIVDHIHTRLEECGKGVAESTIPIEQFVITKTLARNPEDYSDAKGQAHVQVALRHNSRSGGRSMRAGDTVEYVICASRGEGDVSTAMRAFTPEEIKKQEDLVIDTRYYLAHQLHPVVSRLVEPMEETGAARVAECLGLDPTQYHQRAAAASNENVDNETVDNETSWADCEPLTLTCPLCSKNITLTDPPSTSPWACPHCRGTISHQSHKPAILNQMTLQIKTKISAYYRRWLVCEDSGCGYRTRRLPSRFKRGHPVCPNCSTNLLRPEYSDSRLYRQLLFYRRLFNVKAKQEKLFTPEELNLYLEVESHVDNFLAKSAFAVVDLTKLFGAVMAVHHRAIKRSL